MASKRSQHKHQIIRTAHWRLSLSTVGAAPASRFMRARKARARFLADFFIYFCGFGRFWRRLCCHFWFTVNSSLYSVQQQQQQQQRFSWHWPEERTHTYTAQRLTQTWLNKAGQQFPYLPEVLVVQLSSTALRWGYCVFESSRPVTKATSFSPWQSQVTKKMTHC